MRPTLDEIYVQMLNIYKQRATCVRRQVAAILTDKRGQLISAGYNGVPPGYPHCTESPCSGALDKSGDTSRCHATHAEANCLLQAGLNGRLNDGHTLYCSSSPCFSCIKMIVSTNVKRVVYIDPYPDEIGHQLLRDMKITLVQVKA